MANQIVIVIPDDVEAELQSAMTDYSLNALKRVAIDAISKEINIAVSTAHAVAQQEERVLDQLSEFLPDDLATPEEDKIHILINAVGAHIRDLKVVQGKVLIASKLADDATQHVAALIQNKEQLAKLYKDWKLLVKFLRKLRTNQQRKQAGGIFLPVFLFVPNTFPPI